jgi:uncharacterized membrane protein HdeD (DUF308 family)
MEVAMSTLSPGLPGTPLLHTLARYWWLFLLRGIAAIIFGVLAFMWPGITLFTLVLFWGVFAVVDGVLALANAFMGGGMGSRWWLVLVGLIGIAAGVVAFEQPLLTAVVLLYFVAGWAIALGVFQIIGAIQLRKQIDNEWTLILSGIVSVLFGILLIAAPGAGLIGLVWVIAAYAIVFGVLLIGFAFRLKKQQDA